MLWEHGRGGCTLHLTSPLCHCWASDNIPVSLLGDHCGKKYPTMVFNVTVGHNRRVINVAGPFPGAFSDKNTVGREPVSAGSEMQPPMQLLQVGSATLSLEH